jgi:putative phosphonate metabolism protein
VSVGPSPANEIIAMNEPRYAIYFVPPASSALYRFGAGFLGYDCYAGESLGHPPDIALAASEWEELTREPRKYGFHATFKAPFHLSAPFTQADLAVELERFAAIPRTLPVIEPAIQSLARFIAVVAVEPSIALDRLAADGVMAFDRFRRPLTLREKEQRLGAGLSERQIENLDRWGYPYVFEDFRFHMTLTGPIDADRRRSILALLQARFNDINCGRSLPIAQLALVRQEARSMPFRIVDQAALTAARSGP